MRTSRISRDTHKIITSSLSTPRTRPLRQNRARNGALQNYALNAVAASDVTGRESAGAEASGQSDSELSSGRDASESDFEVEHSSLVRRKRKRGEDVPTPATTISRHSEEVSVTTEFPAKFQSKKPKKARRIPAKKVVGPDGSVKIEPPPNWEEIYALTREMRHENVAPVDTMGCESLADGRATPRDQRFQTLVALMLSSQTKDTVTSVAIKGMQENMPGGFNLESVLAMEPTTLNSFINKVGFHNLKTKYIKAAAEILRDKYNSDIPDTIEGLTSLPGVGPKMAYLCMSAAWGRDEGIGVDVHVHRITNLWGWHKTKSPEETRTTLQSWLPRDRWHDINNLLVGFGQTICLPVRMKCGECKLADRGLCPSAVVGRATKVKKQQVAVKEEDGGGQGMLRQTVDMVAQQDIKAEDVDEGEEVPDIEDFVQKSRRRSNRLIS